MPAIVTANNAMRRVPKTFDGGDIDDQALVRPGHELYGMPRDRETTPMRAGVTNIYLLGCLRCGACGAIFCHYWV